MQTQIRWSPGTRSIPRRGEWRSSSCHAADRRPDEYVVRPIVFTECANVLIILCRQDIRHDIQESHGGMADMLRDMSCRLDQQDRRGEDMYYLLVRYIMRSAGRNQSHELNQQYDQVTTTETITAGLQRLSPTTVAPDSPCTHTTVRCDTSPPSTITQDMGSCRGSYSNDRCPPSCRCRCHRPPISAIPAWLQFIFGRALIHHDWLSAIASARTACNDRECRRHRSNLLQIKYCCPTWFAQINAEIRTERVPIHFVIQTPKIVQSLAWIDHATLDEVRQKLWSRELTVNDVDLNGCSVVHVSTSFFRCRAVIDGRRITAHDI